MAILKESVYVAIMHWLRAKRGLGRTRNGAGGLGACVFRKSRGLTELIRAFEDARIVQL
jgi:hypothetical protein